LRRQSQRSVGQAIAAADKEEEDVLQTVKRHLLGLEFPIPAGRTQFKTKMARKMSHLFDGDER